MKEIVLNHPLITHKLSILRDKETGTKQFREIISEISILLCYEATRDAKLHVKDIETPIQKMKTLCLGEDEYAFVPILRAGMSMVDGIIKRHKEELGEDIRVIATGGLSKHYLSLPIKYDKLKNAITSPFQAGLVSTFDLKAYSF